MSGQDSSEYDESYYEDAAGRKHYWKGKPHGNGRGRRPGPPPGGPPQQGPKQNGGGGPPQKEKETGGFYGTGNRYEHPTHLYKWVWGSGWVKKGSFKDPDHPWHRLERNHGWVFTHGHEHHDSFWHQGYKSNLNDVPLCFGWPCGLANWQPGGSYGGWQGNGDDVSVAHTPYAPGTAYHKLGTWSRDNELKYDQTRSGFDKAKGIWHGVTSAAHAAKNMVSGWLGRR